MESLWNEFDLKIPPLITIHVPDVNFAKQAQSVFIKTNFECSILHDELANSAALLSRLMARRKNSFRNMSGFKIVCKLNSALSRLLKVDIGQVLKNFFQTFPEATSVSPNEVPSRNSFDYVLLKIVSVHKLLERISWSCEKSADYFNKLMMNNFFMEITTLFVSVVARLWNLSIRLGNAYCDMYSKLIVLRKCFPQSNSNNYFEGFKYPNRLQRFVVQDLKEANPNGHSNAITKHTETPQIIPALKLSTSIVSQSQKREDLGMPINRNSMKPVVDLSAIHNIDDIRRFFKLEEEERKKSMDSCATKYILKHEWLKIQKIIERKIIANDHKKAITMFRNFITSKI